MRKIDLRPYHGEILSFTTLKELRAAYRKKTGSAYPYSDNGGAGRFVMLEGHDINDRVFLLYADGPAALAHEVAHILLIVCKTIGHDPREGDGEPFCYMLSQIMLECKHGSR